MDGRDQLRARAKLRLSFLALSLLLPFWPRLGQDQNIPSQAKSTAHYRKNYEFTADWFTTRIDLWTRVLAPFKDRENVAYLEVGVHEGRALLWMLENILTHPTARATCIDLFGGRLEQRLRRNLDLSGAADKVTVIKGFSAVELRKLPLDSFEIIYIDASHRGKDVFVDAAESWGLLKKGGLLIFDDYAWDVAPLLEDRPKLAIDAFLTLFNKEIQVLEKTFQVIVLRQR
jgi:predicted O-methyltransferase YrrM